MTLASCHLLQDILSNGNEVAVKQLFAQTNQGIDEFLNEVVLLTGMKHRNLVNLRGCCMREQQRFLVYEYLDNYDVNKILLGKSNPHSYDLLTLFSNISPYFTMKCSINPNLVCAASKGNSLFL